MPGEAHEAPTVELVHPDGVRRYEATNPVELYRLVGAGYGLADTRLSLAEAAERLAPGPATPADEPAPITHTTDTRTTSGSEQAQPGGTSKLGEDGGRRPRGDGGDPAR